MKKFITVSILILSSLATSFALSLTPEWAREYEAANYLADKGIINDVRKEVDASDINLEIAWARDIAIIEAYRLWSTITRKEVLKVVMKLSEKDVPDTCNGSFSDVVNDWGCKYIEAALREWYIAANNEFRPDDNITKTEAMKLVLKAKWVEKIHETDNWQKDYADTAFEYGIVESEYTDYNVDATRGWIFSIATSTIQKEEEIQQKIEEKKAEVISDEVNPK